MMAIITPLVEIAVAMIMPGIKPILESSECLFCFLCASNCTERRHWLKMPLQHKKAFVPLPFSISALLPIEKNGKFKLSALNMIIITTTTTATTAIKTTIWQRLILSYFPAYQRPTQQRFATTYNYII